MTVYTSDIKYAGTDADVCVTLFGEKDGAPTSSPVDMPLATSKNNFERNMTDVFDLPAMADLGELTKVSHVGCNYIPPSTRPSLSLSFPSTPSFAAVARMGECRSTLPSRGTRTPHPE